MSASGWPARTASTSGSGPSDSNQRPSMTAGSSMRPMTRSSTSALRRSISVRFMPVCTASATSGCAARNCETASSSSAGTMLGSAPTRMRSWRGASAPARLSAAASTSSMMRSAWRRKRMPAAVRSVPARWRTSSRVPTSSSSSVSVLDTAGWVRPSRAPARPRCWVCATVTKQCRCRSRMRLRNSSGDGSVTSITKSHLNYAKTQFT
ncbi:hypothetical protein D3C81_1402060 [compost metagenome]